MKDCYNGMIKLISRQIAQEFLNNEEDLIARSLFLDADIAEIIRRVGLETTKLVLEGILSDVVDEKQSEGLVIHRNPEIEFNVIFGKIAIRSPYLWEKGDSSKPLADMGITHQGRSGSVNRALSDFGIEESFRRAAERFEEHYKYETGSSTVARVTKETAVQAQEYIESKLSEAGRKYGEIRSDTQIEKLPVELDGCDIRTAQMRVKENTDEVTPVRNLPKKEKIIEWKEVRTGLCRPLEAVTKTYVGKMDSYPEAVRDLFNACVLIGMGTETRVIGVADGGKGLKEELELQFHGMQFILDKTHLKDHLYETAESLGLTKEERKLWVVDRLDSISRGGVLRIKAELEEDYGRTSNARLKRLIGYIERFSNSMNYNDFKAKGYPVGSGEVESAHKSVPQKRLKISGACWNIDSVNPMLSLRILRADDWWKEFWKQREERKIAA